MTVTYYVSTSAAVTQQRQCVVIRARDGSRYDIHSDEDTPHSRRLAATNVKGKDIQEQLQREG